MKKSLSTIVLFLFALSTWADGIKINGIRYILDQTTMTASVTGTHPSFGPNDYTGEIIIPEKVTYEGNVYTVETIGAWAFNNTTVTSVILPNSITRLEECAFLNTDISSISIPESVVYIGKSCFEWCQNLTTDIIIPNSVIQIDDQAFYNLPITSVTLGNSLQYIGEFSFAYTKIDQLSLPASLQKIGHGCFWGCEKLSSLIFQDSPCAICDNAFYNCPKIATVNFGSKLKSVGECAFGSAYEDISLTSVTLPSTVETIGEFAFGNNLKTLIIGDDTPISSQYPGTRLEKRVCINNNIEVLKLGNTVVSISKDIFHGTQISELTIPVSMISIGEGAFSECGSLTELKIENAAVSIDKDAFY